MKLRTVSGFTKRLIFDHGAQICTALSCVGVFATAIFTAKAQIKADEAISDKKEERRYYKDTTGISQPPVTKEEVVKDCWRYYIPPVIIGGMTIGGIIAANVLGERQYKQLAAMYATCAGSYKMYRDEVAKEYGKETDISIQNNVLKERAAMHIPNCDEEDDLGGEVLLWWDPYAERYFRRTMRQVREAEYHLNRNLSLRGYVPLSELYEFLYLDVTKDSETLGWDSDYLFDSLGSNWLDFDHALTKMDDGMECYILSAIVDPIEGDL